MENMVFNDTNKILGWLFLLISKTNFCMVLIFQFGEDRASVQRSKISRALNTKISPI